MSEQITLRGGIAGEGVLDMTSGLLGMQREVNRVADVNLDLSPYRKVTVRGDFTRLPFKNDAFDLVLFDPPHTIDKRNTLLGTLEPHTGLGPHLGAFKYGCYRSIDQLRKGVYNGAAEAHRVLKPGGILIFKWSNSEKPYSWATDTVEHIKGWQKDRIALKKSGAHTGNYSFYVWYRKL